MWMIRGLYCFFIVPGRLSAREYRSRADSLDSAVTAALREAADALPEYESGADVKAGARPDLTRSVMSSGRLQATRGSESAKVERVTRTGSGWTGNSQRAMGGRSALDAALPDAAAPKCDEV